MREFGAAQQIKQQDILIIAPFFHILDIWVAVEMLVVCNQNRVNSQKLHRFKSNGEI